MFVVIESRCHKESGDVGCVLMTKEQNEWIEIMYERYVSGLNQEVKWHTPPVKSEKELKRYVVKKRKLTFKYLYKLIKLLY